MDFSIYDVSNLRILCFIIILLISIVLSAVIWALPDYLFISNYRYFDVFLCDKYITNPIYAVKLKKRAFYVELSFLCINTLFFLPTPTFYFLLFLGLPLLWFIGRYHFKKKCCK